MPFQRHPDAPPPQIEEHSKAKLRVLRSFGRTEAQEERAGFSHSRSPVGVTDALPHRFRTRP